MDRAGLGIVRTHISKSEMWGNRFCAGVGKRFAALGLMVCAVGLAGCRSTYINADVKNETGGTIQVMEVDYPGGSFGTSDFAAGATFHYRFKVLGSGGTKVLWTGADRKDHTVTGPPLHEGQQGHVTVMVGQTAAGWQTELTQ
jgi:hypothetical protein